MANTPNAAEVVQQHHLRAFTQRGGPRPNQRVRYAGADEQYIMFDDVTDPIRGGINPIRQWDPFNRDAYRLIGTTFQPPDLSAGKISFKKRHGGISWVAGDLSCPMNFYELVGQCEAPDDFNLGWSDFLTVYSYSQADIRTYTKRTSDTADDPLMDAVDFKFGAVYDLGGLSFGENASVQVERETVDVAFGGASACGNCGVYDDGTKWIYALTKSSGSGSPGTPAEVVWTIDAGLTYSNVNITGLTGTVDPTGLDIVGGYAVVLDTAGGGYWYAEIDGYTGTPTNWTFVSIGFNASSPPVDLYVLSNSEIYFAGRAGRIYRSRDIPAGVETVSDQSVTTTNFARINGSGDTIVAVGESGVLVKSDTRGQIWSTPTTAVPTSDTIRTVEVLDRFRWWVGTSGGSVYYTLDGGVQWGRVIFPNAVVIDDIVFATDEVGWVAARTPDSTTARLYTTYNGGFNWTSSALSRNPRIRNFQTFSRANRIAVPRKAKPVLAGNVVALAGLSAGGTDGILLQGRANFQPY